MKRLFGIFVLTYFSFFFFFNTCSNAQEKTKITTQITSTYVDRQVLKFDDIEDHVILMNEWEGVNLSNGNSKFMVGADVSFITYGDYIKGNGHFWGYAKMTLNEEVMYSKIEGKTTTTLSIKGKPISTHKGTLTFTKGTGQFKGIQGNCTFENKMISKRIMITELEGDYFIKK